MPVRRSSRVSFILPMRPISGCADSNSKAFFNLMAVTAINSRSLIRRYSRALLRSDRAFSVQAIIIVAICDRSASHIFEIVMGVAVWLPPFL